MSGLIINPYRFASGGGAPEVAPTAQKLEDTSDYDSFPVALRRADGTLIVVARRGETHNGGGNIRKWISSDKAASWSSSQIYDSGGDDRNPGGGILTGGTIVIFSNNESALYAHRSTDGGATWSTTDVSALRTSGYGVLSAFGRVVDIPGRALMTLYENNGSTYKVFLAESTDDGASWSRGADIVSGATQYNETCIFKVSGSTRANTKLIAVTRTGGGVGQRLTQFVSSDGGQTWSKKGLLNFTASAGSVSPDLFALDSERVMLAWADRASKTIRVATADPAAAHADIAAWDIPHAIYHTSVVTLGNFGYPSAVRADLTDTSLMVVFYDEQAVTDTDLRQEPIPAAALIESTPSTALLASYPLDEGSGSVIADASGNDRDGAVGSGAWVSTGLDYAGGQSTLFTLTEDDCPGDFSFLVVAKATSFGSSKAMLANYTGGGFARGFIAYATSAGKAAFDLKNRSDDAYRSAVSASSLSTGTWFAFGGSLRGTAMSTYVNGAEDGVGQSYDGLGVYSAQALRLAGLPDGSLDFTGSIATVRLYRRGLSSAEHASEYAALKTLLAGRGISLP